MKRIVYENVANGLAAVLTPCEGARLAFGVTLPDGTILRHRILIKAAKMQGDKEIEPAIYMNEARPVDSFMRGWSGKNATAEWAETEDEFLARIASKDVPVTLVKPYTDERDYTYAMMVRFDAVRLGLAFSETPYKIVDDAALPDRAFRGAWRTCQQQGLRVDMDAARDIHRGRLRAARAPKLAALDIEYQRADEAEDTDRKRALAARKQALRDVTNDPRINLAATPAELAAVIPQELA
jgi:hypothetical protein